MIRFRYILTAGLLASCAGGAMAQGYPTPTYGQPSYATPFAPPDDADQLAQQMRLLATDPSNLYALLAAANLSLKLGDTDGAAALFTRAEKVAPGNPQVMAGMGRLLVNAQRPGEALRMFQQAAAAGASDRDFGSDRALAYDLLGEQQRAQREYRALLRRGPDDEATRRYALSLGISGLRDPALALLDPLNRRSDRGAWRVRAFVLAMTGDRAGAERIAVTMMPPGMADGLRPFFDRLPRMTASDRAFAVHFGEVRSNATRLADARRVPPLPALAPEADPFPPVRIAAQVAAVDTGKKRKRDRKLAAPVQVASAGYSAPLPPPPAPTATQLASLGATRLAPPPMAFAAAPNPSRGVTVLPPPAEAYRPAPTRLALATPSPALARITATALPPSNVAEESGDEGPDENVAPPVNLNARTGAPTTTGTALLPPKSGVSAGFAGTPFTLQSSAPEPAAASVSQPVVPAVAPPVAVAASEAQPEPATGAISTAIPGAPAPVAATVPPDAPLAVPPPAGPAGDAVLAAIVANITVPESELNAGTAAASPARRPLLTNVEKQADPALKSALAAAKGKLPPKDARGRFVDAKGKPLLDPRGRPMDAKAAAAWQAAQVDDTKPILPKKDARGRYLDGRGRPLLDARGRPMDAKAAANWLAGQDDASSDKIAKVDPKLPPRDARGRFVDPKGKPLLDARGRPMDAKAAAAWKLADAKPKPDPAKGEPQRYWVQVAGGANEETLAKEWQRVSAQAAGLKGKQGWTTPLRATNRVLTGPFKSSAEAMGTVNQLKKQGVAAFMFTSDPGQKVTRLPAK